MESSGGSPNHDNDTEATHRAHHARKCSQHPNQVLKPVDLAGRDSVPLLKQIAPSCLGSFPFFYAAGTTAAAAAATAPAPAAECGRCEIALMSLFNVSSN